MVSCSDDVHHMTDYISARIHRSHRAVCTNLQPQGQGNPPTAYGGTNLRIPSTRLFKRNECYSRMNILSDSSEHSFSTYLLLIVSLERVTFTYMVVEVAGLTEHLLSECEASRSRGGYARCPRCSEAFLQTELAAHLVTQPSCQITTNPILRCPLCHTDINAPGPKANLADRSVSKRGSPMVNQSSSASGNAESGTGISIKLANTEDSIPEQNEEVIPSNGSGTTGGPIEEAWKAHLMGQGSNACANNPRRLPQHSQQLHQQQNIVLPQQPTSHQIGDKTAAFYSGVRKPSLNMKTGAPVPTAGRKCLLNFEYTSRFLRLVYFLYQAFYTYAVAISLMVA
ncbi:unnamed protein product [Protopolystoma xenopodis]|uniref:Centrosomal protein CEP104 Zn finger domain-containing protein n=1 Tax=Protopolystoma xenopodis TaxID=117903 RepID=A0A448WDZ1_9PLAT|nr:unnamed protein product [Protopolystoma xenopodis]